MSNTPPQQLCRDVEVFLTATGMVFAGNLPNGEYHGIRRFFCHRSEIRLTCAHRTSCGWTMLAVLAAYLINNVLDVGFGFGRATTFITAGNTAALVPLIVYAVAIGLAILYVFSTRQVALRWDAHIIHKFNVYIIRACFWSVLLVGIVDTGIAFMRVEDLWGGDTFP